MTKKQEEAIEFLEFYMKHCLRQELENLENYETINDEEFVSYNIKTVLNMLKENSAEIQQENTELAEKTAEIERQKEKNKQLSNQMLMLLKEQDNYNARIEKKNAEIEKKDKIIDLMAERINWLCKTNGILLDRDHGVNFDEKDIKQYFERKAEDGEN